MKESFSVVIPVYNSHNTLPDLCSKLNETFFENDLEIILVDDGSRDNSWEQIKRLKAQYGSKLTGIRLSKNFGQQNATICGFDQATKEYLVTMDDDQQYLPESISMLHKTLVDGNFDIVYGLAIVKKQSLMRLIGFRFVSLLALLFSEKIIKTSAFRIMRRDLADNLKNYKFYFALIDELVKLYTSNIGYCSVPHHNRSGSESGYSIWKLIKMVARSIIAYSAIPYKLFLFSFLTSATAFGMLLVYYLKFGSISNAAFMLVTVFSVVLFLLGFTLLFAYLFHITGYISKKPLYHISEKI